VDIAELNNKCNIQENLLPSGLRIFLAQEIISSVGVSLWIRLRSEILFELSKIFRNAPNVNF